MNSTNYHDDPRLTAYVLGELSQSDREQVEALLRDDAEARRAVEEIRTMSGLLTSELSNQTADTGLTDAQRAAITSTAARPQRSLRSRFVIGVASGLAAAAMIGLSVSFMLPTLNRARETAHPMVSHYAEPRPGQTAPTATARKFQYSGGVPATDEAESHVDAFKQDSSGLADQLKAVQSGGAPVASGTPATNQPSNLSILGTTLANQRETGINGVAIGSRNRGYAFGTQAEWDSRGANSTGGFKLNNSIDGKEIRAKSLDVAGDAIAEREIRENISGHNTEAYDRIVDNAFLEVAQNPLSTFSIDVDTASYSNVRRFINDMSRLPPKDAVRIEEMVNYFPYSYSTPKGDAPNSDAPFSSNIEVAGCPWNSERRLVRIALKGKEIAQNERPASNLVFLIDVSGSMQPANKLPLLKSAMQRMVQALNQNDHVAIVVYAGNSGLVLPSTQCDDEHKRTVIDALGRLEAGGSTNGAEGIQLAYDTAAKSFMRGATNRVILCTDGDFNVGVTNQGDLTRLIEEKAKSGVFLSVLGFGMDNLKDSTMEKLADKGNGNYAYIDTASEANKVLVEQMSGTLVTIAKDVKIQVEFNPAKVGSYRLIGYENRMLAKEDFNDDKKDAGEIGAGHTVTALYEITPVGAKAGTLPVDPLKYQSGPRVGDQIQPLPSDELLTVKLRYKAPEAPAEQGTSKLIEFPVKDAGQSFAAASKDFKFAIAVAGFGMILRESPHKGNLTIDGAIELAQDGRGEDAAGYRGEFIGMMRKAKTLGAK